MIRTGRQRTSMVRLGTVVEEHLGEARQPEVAKQVLLNVKGAFSKSSLTMYGMLELTV